MLVYVPMTDEVCWFEGAHLTKTALRIRHAPAANGQGLGVLHAAAFAW